MNDYTDLAAKIIFSVTIVLITFVLGSYALASAFGEQVPLLLHSVDTMEKLAEGVISNW